MIPQNTHFEKFFQTFFAAMSAARADDPDVRGLQIVQLLHSELVKVVGVLGKPIIEYPEYRSSAPCRLFIERYGNDSILSERQGLVLVAGYNLGFLAPGSGHCIIALTNKEEWLVLSEKTGAIEVEFGEAGVLSVVLSDTGSLQTFIRNCRFAVKNLIQERLKELECAQNKCLLAILDHGFEVGRSKETPSYINTIEQTKR